ncbi:MAG TPA: Lpg1974 family pore-forming outer membrane protein, partial [Rhabdochlamydiaceae bacterium]|nr:Lpg1974 family pore-forming outer membrane protein [Rhabdochlamydiaceae bacterium]
LWPQAALSMVAVTTLLSADRHDRRGDYNRGDDRRAMHCDRISICGPEVPMAVNPSVRPFTDDACCCDEGEFSLTLAGFYWQATQDGLEYAIESTAVVENPPTFPVATGTLLTLIDGSYRNPEFKWKPGFKVGLGYNTTHDGWDIELIWTHYNGRAKSSDDNESDLNVALQPLWSAFAPVATADNVPGTVLYATQANTSWRLDLNLVDLELGREYYTSKMLTLRPFVGLRYASLHQRYNIQYLGGSYDGSALPGPFIDDVKLKNEFDGGGVRAGLDTNWWFGCCPGPCPSNWGFFGDFAASLIYGKFDVDHDENLQSPLASTGFAKTPVLETDEHFRSIRGIIDLALGLQYETLYRDGNWGMNLSLAWEFHHFFNQNQLWRVVRIGDASADGVTLGTHGENTFNQRRGDLSTQGVTFTARFTF